jgi:hypothetical protein
MAFDGQLLNRPSDPSGERAVSDALFVYYYGVYAPAPSDPVLSPNGDGADERELLSYKVVAQSTVTARIVGPDGVARFAQTASQAPGTYKFTFPGTKADGSVDTEGRWHWVVNSVDAQGRSSSADQTFWLNNTLGFLKTPAAVAVRAGRRVTVASFKLTRPARVTTTIESPSGLVVRTLAKRALVRAGSATVRWDGRDRRGHLVYGGKYVVRVHALNGFGPSDLTQAFRVSRR